MDSDAGIFKFNSCFLTDPPVNQTHCRDGHPSTIKERTIKQKLNLEIRARKLQQDVLMAQHIVLENEKQLLERERDKLYQERMKYGIRKPSFH